MTPYPRKLLPTDHNPSLITQNPSSPSPPLPASTLDEGENPPTTTTSYTNYTGPTCCAYNNLKLSPPFDSAMALTVLVLLMALFFMGFFSIYIRRFADESSVDPTRRRGRRRSDLSSSAAYLQRTKKGLDPKTVESLPVHAYHGGGAKQGIEMEECAICLGEFEEKGWVKEIPYCGHVFHVECIDTWLESHVTCPLCRTAKLFAGDDEEGKGVSLLSVGEVQENDGGDERRDTWSEEGGEREVRVVVG